MSLLLDALKKAEEAKRRRAAGLSAADAPAAESAPPVAAEAPPTLSLSMEPAPPTPPAEPVQALPPLSALTLEPVEPRQHVEESEPEAVDVLADAPPALDVLVADEPEPPQEAVTAVTETPAAPVVEASAPTEATSTPVQAAPVAPPIVVSPQPQPVAPPAPTATTPGSEPSRPAAPAPAPVSAVPRRDAPMQLSPEAARQLFDAKPGHADARARRNRVALLVGLCLSVAVAAAGWLWWQWQSSLHGSMLLANPVNNAANPPIEADLPLADGGIAPPEGDAAASEAVKPTAKPASKTAADKPAAPVHTASETPLPPPKPALPVAPRPGDRARVVEIPANVAAPDVRFVRDSQDATVPKALQQAYDAFQQGDYGRAAELYRQHLRQDSKSRDALLGLAAVAVQRQQLDEARNLYRRILADNPRDELANSALTSISTLSDPDAAEGKLRAQMQSNPRPETAQALGNLLARQSRWSEAQEFYFQAHSTAPDEPDYAYNLAIALDALGERKLAADYYRKALNLSSRKPAAFDAEAARRRLSKLGGE